MSLLPAPLEGKGDWLDARQAGKARRTQASVELAVYRHGLESQAQAEVDRQDSQAVADATRTALEEELDLFDYGMDRVDGSATKAELVARHVERLSAINNTRITRRFGG
jgi:hypothetical protein